MLQSTSIASDHRPVVEAPSSLLRPHTAAVIRIGFGIIWGINASFKWLPGFIHGQTIAGEFRSTSKIDTPVIHEWIQLWKVIATADPAAFAVGTAVVETLIALCLLLGAFSNAVFVGSAVFAFGIWSTVEGFHLPWTRPGITDLGPAAAYPFASLALLCAAAGSTWSLDQTLRARLGRFAWLTSPALPGASNQSRRSERGGGKHSR